MEDNLRQKTITGSFWALAERFGYLTLQFVSNIVLARLLLPEDFGLIGILLIFVVISEVLVDSGFSTALVQRKNILSVDKSTVFYINLLLSFIIYIFLFFLSPTISDFFNDKNLSLLLRLIEFKIVIDALGTVQFALLKRNMNFRLIAKVRIISILFAVSVSIFLAALGYGVYALIIQHLVFSLLRVILVWIYSEWRPKLEFSFNSLSYLFGFGSKLMLQQILSETYENFQSVLIGKYFCPSDLGFYTQAKQLQYVPVSSLTSVITSVSFPAFSKFQDQKIKLKAMVRRNLNALLFINTPLMCFLTVLAKPIIVLLYSEKWLSSVPYFQFLCLGFGVFLVIHQSNLTLLKAVGRSDYILYLELIKKTLGFIFLIIGMNLYGIWGILYGLLINSFLEMFFNGFFVNKEINYSVLEQFKDLALTLLYSLFPSLVVLVLVNHLSFSSNFILIILMTVIFWGLYYLVAKLMKSHSLLDFENIFKEYIIKK